MKRWLPYYAAWFTVVIVGSLVALWWYSRVEGKSVREMSDSLKPDGDST